MHEVFLFMAFCGFIYGAYALYSVASFSDVHREELNSKDAELQQQILEGGWRGAVFRVGRPLFWLVVLPARSVLAALGVAMMLVLPFLLTQ